jgi:hypothetical protein
MNELIKYPRLEIFLSNSRSTISTGDKIILTPNSINGNLKRLGDKFLFGRNSGNLSGSLVGNRSTQAGTSKANDFNFSDESVGSKQFEISYNKDSTKYTIVDNKRGTGLFIKIKQKNVIKQDMIVSFCASHMILQVENDCNLLYLIFKLILLKIK